MLLDKKKSCVMLIDVQEKLFPMILAHEKIQTNIQHFLTAIDIQSIPLIVTEQYPKGLGKTIQALQPYLDKATQYEKMAFSCFKDEAICQALLSQDYEQFVLLGIETHVCVLQTALDLLAKNKTVYVVADCVGSRVQTDYQLGLARMRHLGVQIISWEMALFEWCELSGTPLFKSLSKDVLLKREI